MLFNLGLQVFFLILRENLRMKVNKHNVLIWKLDGHLWTQYFVKYSPHASYNHIRARNKLSWYTFKQTPFPKLNETLWVLFIWQLKKEEFTVKSCCNHCSLYYCNITKATLLILLHPQNRLLIIWALVICGTKMTLIRAYCQNLTISGIDAVFFFVIQFVPA